MKIENKPTIAPDTEIQNNFTRYLQKDKRQGTKCWGKNTLKKLKVGELEVLIINFYTISKERLLKCKGTYGDNSR